MKNSKKTSLKDYISIIYKQGGIKREESAIPCSERQIREPGQTSVPLKEFKTLPGRRRSLKKWYTH
ncbi:hypothetical protein UR09_00910 [Candidatus Nitromaritima sp. SCGC AAA799-A02]|nr:hypothetical protein UZ36_06950 [Candidatus Nitromaritima sp. SCGC AAA799-C22]KMP12615.1 hypothetical protein UR09_00910 [Candidatus Nitromaritima sp. SCGC AAA799-A02]